MIKFALCIVQGPVGKNDGTEYNCKNTDLLLGCSICCIINFLLYARSCPFALKHAIKLTKIFNDQYSFQQHFSFHTSL